MKVLVYGAAGSQQFPVIQSLQKRGASVVATTQRQTNLPRLQDAGAMAVAADLADRDRIMQITRDIDAIAFLVPFFLPNPADAFAYARNVVDAAAANGVKMLVWNTSGYLLPQKIGNPALDVRLDILEYLRQSGLNHLVIQPSVYAENLLGPWTVPYVKNEKRVAYPTPADMPLGWIATADVAELVAEAIHHPELAGENFRVSGLENLTGEQLATKFSIGLSDNITYYALPPKDFGRVLDEAYGPGAGKGAEAMYQEISDTRQYPVMFAPDMRQVLQKLPVAMTAMEDWVRQHQAWYKYA